VPLGTGYPMRVLKFLALVAMPLAFFLAIGMPRHSATLWAQLPPPNPLTAPRAVPSAPAQLPAPVPPQGLPSLAVVPSPATASPTPAARAFSCSCFGPGSGTSWMGQVTAAGYFAARQSATGACAAYNSRTPQSPFIAPRQTTTAALPTLPQGFQPGNLAGSPQIIGTESAQQLKSAGLQQTLPVNSVGLSVCEQCTCD
jgi:hypothetical protein